MQILVFFLLFICKFSDVLGDDTSNHNIPEHEADQLTPHSVTNRLTRNRKGILLLQKLENVQVSAENNPLFSTNDEGTLPVYEICLAFLKEFGQNAADFIKCTVEKARPFRFCESCVKEYKRAMTTFQDILQVHVYHN